MLLQESWLLQKPDGVNLYCFDIGMIFLFLLSGIFITESDFELLMRFIVPGVVENNNICQSKINELDQRTPEAEEYNN